MSYIICLRGAARRPGYNIASNMLYIKGSVLNARVALVRVYSKYPLMDNV